MSFSSLITILKVNEPRPIKTKSGKEMNIYTAEAMLLDEHGQVDKVGQLGYPELLKDAVKPGSFTGIFGLTVAEYGLDQGRIVARLTGLIPVPPKAHVHAPAQVQTPKG